MTAFFRCGAVSTLFLCCALLWIVGTTAMRGRHAEELDTDLDGDESDNGYFQGGSGRFQGGNGEFQSGSGLHRGVERIERKRFHSKNPRRGQWHENLEENPDDGNSRSGSEDKLEPEDESYRGEVEEQPKVESEYQNDGGEAEKRPALRSYDEVSLSTHRLNRAGQAHDYVTTVNVYATDSASLVGDEKSNKNSNTHYAKGKNRARSNWSKNKTLVFHNNKSPLCPHGTVFRVDCRICFCIESVTGRASMRCDSKFTRAECANASRDVHCDANKLLYDYQQQCEGTCACNEARNITTCEYLPCNETLLWFHGYYKIGNAEPNVNVTESPGTETTNVESWTTAGPGWGGKDTPDSMMPSSPGGTSTTARHTTSEIVIEPVEPVPVPGYTRGEDKNSTFKDGFKLEMQISNKAKYVFKHPDGSQNGHLTVQVVPKCEKGKRRKNKYRKGQTRLPTHTSTQ